MKYRPTIQRSISCFLLLLFVVCTAPKIYLHDALADHIDSQTVCSHPFPDAPCLHKTTPNCQVDLLVISSFFLFKADVSISYLRQGFRQLNCFVALRYSCLHPDGKEGRGPPARS